MLEKRGKALLLGGVENWRSDGDGYDKGQRKKWKPKKKRLMRHDKRCFPFLKTHSPSLLFPLFLFPPLGLISPSLACPDGLKSAPGKTGHPSPPLHLTPPPSPLLLTCPEANLPLHLAPWVRAGGTSAVLRKRSALMKHYVKQYPVCWAQLLEETTFFFFSSWFTATLFQNEPVYMRLKIQTFVCPAALSAWRQ